MMDGQPVTRAELVEALARQKQELKQELKQEMQGMKQDILEGVQELVRDSQTEILKAFLPHQESTSLRFRHLEATNGSVMDRMAVLERRLQEIEKRLLMNPPAA